MTNKRFTIDFDNRRIIDNKKNEYLVFLAQFKEVLNQLNDENEQLKKQNQRLKEQNNKLRKVTKYYDGIVGGFKIGDL